MKKAVLCVQDETLVESLKNRLLEGSFAEIIVCDGAGTVTQALDHSPALVLIEAESAAGIAATARRIRERSMIPIIVVADDCTEDEACDAADSGISAILTKPLREEELWAALELTLAATRQVTKLTEEVAHLKEQIESRKIVEKAKGRLMERDKLTEAEAFRRMQRLAMDRRISMRQLAEAILLTDRIGH